MTSQLWDMGWRYGPYNVRNNEPVYDRISQDDVYGVSDHDVIVSEVVAGDSKIHVSFTNHYTTQLGKHYHVTINLSEGTVGGWTLFNLCGQMIGP